MAKAIIIYESKYGNTKLVAETIAEGMKQVSGIEPAISELKQVDPKKLAEFDAILIGSPNHVGGATMGIRRFIDKVGKLKLEGKYVAFFDTYMGNQYEKVMKKMEQQLSKKAPGLKLISPGLSIMVQEMKGPISEDELPKCKDFGIKIANQLKG